MRKRRIRVLILAALLCAGGTGWTGPVETLLSNYRAGSAGAFSPQAGRLLWTSEGIRGRSCGNCHGDVLRAPGKHLRTGKAIAPMSPAVNPTRLQNPEKIEKWFKRNCKWTFGRECSAQEKGDLLSWLRLQ